MRVAEPESLQESAGAHVLWVMPSVQAADPESRERTRDDGLGGLTAKALRPECLAKLETKLVDTFFRLVRLKAAAAHMLSRLQQKDGPILEPVPFLIDDFP